MILYRNPSPANYPSYSPKYMNKNVVYHNTTNGTPTNTPGPLTTNSPSNFHSNIPPPSHSYNAGNYNYSKVNNLTMPSNTYAANANTTNNNGNNYYPTYPAPSHTYNANNYNTFMNSNTILIKMKK